MRLAVLFDNLGPYHVARLAALAQRCDLLAVEMKAVSAEYAWTPAESVAFRRVTLDRQAGGTVRMRLDRALAGFAPQVVFVPGWGTPEALTAHLWAATRRVPVVVMSDTQAIDFDRNAVKEWVKRRLVRHVAGALVAGSRHEDYAARLFGRPRPMRLGYDVVDNDHFVQGADAARARSEALRRELDLPSRYLLATARFIPKKNLIRLLDAFASMRELVTRNGAMPWDLVLLGDGAQRPEIEERVAALGLAGAVRLPGFRQYPDLPTFYGLAEAFVMPSTTDQWGLVVNEAMASGLPVLVSTGCGCAADLVEEGVNGFAFDPTSVEELAGLLARLCLATPDRRAAMGAASRQRISAWSPQTFADSALSLAEAALQETPRRMRMLDRLLTTVVAKQQMKAAGA